MLRLAPSLLPGRLATASLVAGVARVASLLPPVASLALAAALVVPVAACSGGPIGVDACKTIETARCKQAASCPDLSMQPPISTSGSPVDACIRYYDTACLHGLAIGTDPGTTAVNQCVTAIENNGCDVVATPEIDPACAWLIPPEAADAGEAGTDAAADAPTE